MPRIPTETWTEDDGGAWGVWTFTCRSCGLLICVVATLETWEAGTTEFQRTRLDEAGEATCTTCAGTALAPDGYPVEEMGS